MYSKKPTGIYKYIGFVLLDILALFLSVLIVSLVLKKVPQREVLIAYPLAELLVIMFGRNYVDIYHRGYGREITEVIKHTGAVTLTIVAMMYALKIGHHQSRLQIGFIFVADIIITYLFRTLRKKHTKRSGTNEDSVLVVSTEKRIDEVLTGLMNEEAEQHFNITGICIIDADRTGEKIKDVPVIAAKDTLLSYVCRNWVDEVFFDLGESYIRPDEGLHESLLSMGIATHVKLFSDNEKRGWDRQIETFGPYTFITRVSKMIDPGQLIAKRLLDIAGGIAGTIITGILFIFLAPIIFISSPGPVIFRQERIGKNGRHFQMYKFRSMVLNADELKARYMAQNNRNDDMMFKLDWDPRIIGNKILPDGTKKTGIGAFIRNTSLDEFPQFINVLKGDMSLVGTRPPTLDEWEKYGLEHRMRMSIRPGITGLWQISGRSDIKDFDEVVNLDSEYIAKWSFWGDVRIILLTIPAVLKGEGSR